MLASEAAARLETLDEDDPARARLPRPLEVSGDGNAPPLFYVDACIYPRKGKKYAHLMTTGTTTDLIKFARGIGLAVAWIQKPGTDLVHFDVTEFYRQKAIAAGALPAASVAMFRACVLTKRAGVRRGNAAELLEVRTGIDAGKTDAPPDDI